MLTKKEDNVMPVAAEITYNAGKSYRIKGHVFRRDITQVVTNLEVIERCSCTAGFSVRKLEGKEAEKAVAALPTPPKAKKAKKVRETVEEESEAKPKKKKKSKYLD